jgi:hypothetical protein
VPPGGLWLLISPPSDAPSPRRLALALAAPAFFSSARGEATGRTRRPKIGTAILSYAEHGKFQAQTQGQPSLLPCAVWRGKGERIKAVASALVAARSSAMSGGSKWTTAGAQAQWATALPIEEAADR